MATQVLTQFPEVSTSSLRELQWSIDFWSRAYAKAGYRSEIAWQMYGDAIDNEEPHSQIDQLFIIATMFDGIRSDAWRKWDEAKAQYLARMN